MELLLSVEQMARMDGLASSELGLPSICLMENAGRGCAEIVVEEIARRGALQTAILCGPGNNGGDGYVIARNLVNLGLQPVVYSLCPASKLKGDAAVNRSVLENMGYQVEELVEGDPLPDFRDFDLVVDAVLGTGIKGAARGMTASLIAALSDSAVPVVSVDIPSGVEGDTGKISGPAVLADRTVTMCAVKRGLLLPPGSDYAGEIHVVDIGYAPEHFAEGAEWTVYHEEDVLDLLPGRFSSSHKGSYGKVLLVAGSAGMGGAALLASRTVMRTGAGMARLAAPAELAATLAPAMPEVMTHWVKGPARLEESAADELLEACDWADALVVGPGMGRHESTMKLVRRLVRESPLPVVLDADGLFAFNGETELFKERNSPLCITPHHGEFLRLLGTDKQVSLHAMIVRASELATDLGLALVLKGAPSVILGPEGDVMVNNTGNDGLSTAGSGDVLTGMIAGLAAQGLELDDAAVAGCHLHGLAGDLCARRLGRRSMTSVELMDSVQAAFLALERLEANPAGEDRAESGHGCSCSCHGHEDH